MMRSFMIIGITGMLGAGKGTVVEYIESKGFKHYSASGFIVEEIEKRGMPVNRDSMTIVGDDLRATYGSAHIIESLLKRAEEAGGNAIIEALHSMGEADMLRAHGAKIIGIDADLKTRYDRIILRKSVKDSVTFEQFAAIDTKESASDDPAKHNLRKVLASADYIIHNDGSIEELQEQVDTILAQVLK